MFLLLSVFIYICLTLKEPIRDASFPKPDEAIRGAAVELYCDRNVRFVPKTDMRQGASSFGGTSKKRPHCSVHDKQRGSERVSFLIRYSPLGLLPFMDFIAARFCGALFGRHCRHLLSRRGIWNAQPQRGHDCRHERKSS
jgi:hypothetical protein